MPNDYGNAGAALRDQSGPEDAGTDSTTDQEDSSQREDTFYLPSDYPGSEDLQPGDTVELRVVGKDKDGQVEVECVHDDANENGDAAPEKKPLMQDMNDSLGTD